MTTYAASHDVTIAVMGCRVNGPGETDDADLGLWCGPRAREPEARRREGRRFGYEEVLGGCGASSTIIASRERREEDARMRMLHTMLRVGDLERRSRSTPGRSA